MRARLDRREFLMAGVAALAGACARHPRAVADTVAQRRPRPSPSQLLWQQDELAIFLHFGVNTFTDREWGDGTEDPAIFNPTALDARQWARVARRTGFRAMILTAKHHDGFCLWPSATTTHTVARSPWRGGNGDVVREFVDACRAEELRAGLYLSPWDRNHPAYGDSPRYNDVYAAQLTELMTRYGKLHELWFDGANGEGPNGKRQTYDWPRVWGLVRQLQPDAVMFSDAGPDVRWCGNERGSAGDPNWSTMDPAAVPYPGVGGPEVIRALQHGDPNGSVWRPAEADTSIRPGWFYHPAEDEKVRSVDDLVELYVQSVGRNSKLLLNVPPGKDGLLHPTDAARLSGFHERLGRLLADDLAERVQSEWKQTGASATLELDLGRPTAVGIARLAEDIRNGQRVSRYTLSGMDDGGWRVLSRGTTIGYAKIDRFPAATVRRVRLSIDEVVAEPERVSVSLF
ncbi:MAG: alpha-L-fucosidase [Gemmatimonadaceae bacterium]